MSIKEERQATCQRVTNRALVVLEESETYSLNDRRRAIVQAGMTQGDSWELTKKMLQKIDSVNTIIAEENCHPK